MKLSKKTASFLGETLAFEVHRYLDPSLRGVILILRDNIADTLDSESRQTLLLSFRQTLDKIEPLWITPARNVDYAAQ